MWRVKQTSFYSDLMGRGIRMRGGREREKFISLQKRRENEGRPFTDDWGKMKRLIGLLSGCSFWRIYKMSATHSHFLSFWLRHVLTLTQVHTTSLLSAYAHPVFLRNDSKRHMKFWAKAHTLFSVLLFALQNKKWNGNNKTRIYSTCSVVAYDMRTCVI